MMDSGKRMTEQVRMGKSKKDDIGIYTQSMIAALIFVGLHFLCLNAITSPENRLGYWQTIKLGMQSPHGLRWLMRAVFALLMAAIMGIPSSVGLVVLFRIKNK